ncbi:hypothetical protein [Ruegeria meonggei]|uniref:Lipoprotein n=1 Tax=Ruegeria meonggei TaxID=1446476 RepID=A0A1X6ZGH6_9RHOB|nr:hypothetical protein [Ruegeria meonggei]SLN50494.1 hypothetical protein RUM8411_02394 [Ruegeria meonggei]
MRSLIAVVSAFLVAACQTTTDGSSAFKSGQRPDDGIAAFVEACIAPNATRKNALIVFDKYRVAHKIASNSNGTFPGGEFVDQQYIEEVGYLKVGARVQGRLKSNRSYCAVRIEGLWLNDAQQPISSALAKNGFRFVEEYEPPRDTPFKMSELSGVYQNGAKYYALLAGQSANAPGRITDLEFFELATN